MAPALQQMKVNVLQGVQHASLRQPPDGRKLHDLTVVLAFARSLSPRPHRNLQTCHAITTLLHVLHEYSRRSGTAGVEFHSRRLRACVGSVDSGLNVETDWISLIEKHEQMNVF
ncbi:hypothetical protein F2P79_010753 [Pimephales promelas]|nr:hypothetical protein F2P79_010753 [Pimephales promelas]